MEPRAEGYGEIEEHKASSNFDALADILKYREDPDLRVAAMEALCEVDPGKAADVLLEFASDENWRVSGKAVEMLASLGDLRCLPFIEGLTRSTDQYDREKAASLLKSINKPESIDLLIDLMDDPDAEVWVAAREAILAMGKIAVPPLMEAIDDFAGYNAAEVLAELVDETAIEPLKERLQGSNEIARYHAILALKRYYSPQILELIAGALKDSRVETRREAARYLANSGEERAIDMLADALDDEDEEVRLRAALSLARRGEPKAVGSLESLAESENMETRKSAISALSGAAGPDSLPKIEKALADDDKFVRREAVEALGKLGTPEAIHRLLFATDDPYELVREKAAELLRALGRRKVEEAVTSLPEHEALCEKIERLLG